MDLQEYKERLLDAQRRLENNEIDEIPLNVRPQMPEFDFNTKSYVVISYSRKDFVKVYLFLTYLYNEGYRFWYDNGMSGTQKWLEEYKEKYSHPNCLGTITFFSDNYISDSTKEELSLIYKNNRYVKRNVMVSLISLKEINVNSLLKHAINDERISISNASDLSPILEEIIKEEKDKTIHRYAQDEDIEFLADKIAKDFNIRNTPEGEGFGHGPVADTAVAVSDAGDFVVMNKTLLRYTGSNSHVIIPDDVCRIEEGVFENCTTMEQLTLPPSLEVIGSLAFRNCTFLKTLTIPETICAIGDQAFKGCISLRTVTFEQQCKIGKIDKEVFKGCIALENLTLHDRIHSIGESAFEGCRSLVSLNLPPRLREIGDFAFRGCTSAVGISDLFEIDSLGKGAFAHCKSLVSINLPHYLTRIEDQTFAYCSSLVNVGMPYMLTHVGNQAFTGCTSLKKIQLYETVTSIGAEVFRGCIHLETVSIPQSVSSIGSGAFLSCNALHSVQIPYGVSFIADMTFWGCSSLPNINIPDSVTAIGIGAFYDCCRFTAVSIPEGVTTIAEEAFGYCYNLSSVTLPKTLQYIGAKAFVECDLTEIKYRGSKKDWRKVKKSRLWLGKLMRVECLDSIED